MFFMINRFTINIIRLKIKNRLVQNLKVLMLVEGIKKGEKEFVSRQEVSCKRDAKEVKV